MSVHGLTWPGRSRLFNWFLGPGPARYQLPPAIGVPNHDPRKWKAPAYTLTGGAKPFKGTGVPGKVYFVVYCLKVKLTSGWGELKRENKGDGNGPLRVKDEAAS